MMDHRNEDALAAPGRVDGDALEVPISAIEHYSYCPRQCALIHVEQTYDENQFTIRGSLAHERVDSGAGSTAGDTRTLRSVPLWSDRLGIRGKADVVEVRPDGLYPVEYKVGRRHGIHADLQLCAQALCLEDMTGDPVHRGAIFYHASKQRHEVMLDDALRRQTVEIIEAIRDAMEKQSVPRAPNDSRCPKCSLLNACLPGVVGEPARLRSLHRSLFTPVETEPDNNSDEW